MLNDTKCEMGNRKFRKSKILPQGEPFAWRSSEFGFSQSSESWQHSGGKHILNIHIDFIDIFKCLDIFQCFFLQSSALWQHSGGKAFKKILSFMLSGAQILSQWRKNKNFIKFYSRYIDNDQLKGQIGWMQREPLKTYK